MNGWNILCEIRCCDCGTNTGVMECLKEGSFTNTMHICNRCIDEREEKENADEEE